MALPTTITVKLSTEAAGTISLTPVVVQEIAFRDLFDTVLATAGKQPERIRDILQRGSIVSGASRYRWAGFTVDADDLNAMLKNYPDAEPGRPFTAARCVKVILRGARSSVEITREAGEKTRVLRRDNFWDALMEALRSSKPDYMEYSYRERADRYRLPLNLQLRNVLFEAADRLAYSTLTRQIQTGQWDAADLFVTR